MGLRIRPRDISTASCNAKVIRRVNTVKHYIYVCEGYGAFFLEKGSQYDQEARGMYEITICLVEHKRRVYASVI